MAEPENDTPPARRPDGTFLPGHSSSTGRPPGATNRIGRDLRNAIMASAKNHGRDGRGRDGEQGFFDFLAAERPKEFAQHCAKLVPTADEEEDVIIPGITSIEVLAVPSNHFFMADI